MKGLWVVAAVILSCLFLISSIFLLTYGDTTASIAQSTLPIISNFSSYLPQLGLFLTTTESPQNETQEIEDNGSLWSNNNKRLTVDSSGCGGLANMLFRLAFLFGVGKRLKRKAYMYDECAVDYKLELVSYFPNLRGLEFRLEDRNYTPINFGELDWTKDDFQKLENASDLDTIMVTGQYLQSFKYFHKYKPGIRKVFQPSKAIQSFIKAYMDNVFSNSTSHKLCIHMRRGFEGHYMIVSEHGFTIHAAQTVAKHLKDSLNISKIDAIIFTDDKTFGKKVATDIMRLTDLNLVHLPTILTRAEEMIMAHSYCDSMILTSAGSTFGWWMAYLMREEAQQRVFYNGLMFKATSRQTMERNFKENDYIPPKWKRIQQFNGKVEFYDRKKPSILY